MGLDIPLLVAESQRPVQVTASTVASRPMALPPSIASLQAGTNIGMSGSWSYGGLSLSEASVSCLIRSYFQGQLTGQPAPYHGHRVYPGGFIAVPTQAMGQI